MSKTATSIRPLNDNILVRREEEEDTTPGGIVLPDAAKQKKAKGRVVAVGSGRLLDNGTRVAPEVAEGDIVYFLQYAGQTIDIDDEELVILSEASILAVESD